MKYKRYLDAKTYTKTRIASLIADVNSYFKLPNPDSSKYPDLIREFESIGRVNFRVSVDLTNNYNDYNKGMIKIIGSLDDSNPEFEFHKIKYHRLTVEIGKNNYKNTDGLFHVWCIVRFYRVDNTKFDNNPTDKARAKVRELIAYKAQEIWNVLEPTFDDCINDKAIMEINNKLVSLASSLPRWSSMED